MSEGTLKGFVRAASKTRYGAPLDLDDARILARPVHVDDIGEIGPFGSLGRGDGRMNFGVDARLELLQLRFFQSCHKRAGHRGEGVAQLSLLKVYCAPITHAFVFLR